MSTLSGALIGIMDLIGGAIPVRQRDRCLVGLFNSYWDGSTDATGEVTSVAGYIASASDWDSWFATRWREVLDREGVKVFHMSDFENYRGEFSGWEKPQHDRLIANLVRVVQQTVKMGIGVALDLRAFRERSPRIRRILGDIAPYHLCAATCVLRARLWREKNKFTEPLTFVFESGDVGTGALKQAIERLARIKPDGFAGEPLTFAPKETVIQLQSADILAYEVVKERRRVLGLHGRNVRASLNALLDRQWDRYEGCAIGREELEGMTDTVQGVV